MCSALSHYVCSNPRNGTAGIVATWILQANISRPSFGGREKTLEAKAKEGLVSAQGAASNVATQVKETAQEAVGK